MTQAGRRESAAALGLLIGGLGPIAVAGTLVPFRDDINKTNAALIFVVLVVVAAACGGRWVGASSAVVCTMSYDFFFTRPYQSLKIDRADDVETTVLLLAVGLIVGEIVAWANRARRARDRGRDEINSFHRVAEQVAAGEPISEIRFAVEAELIGLLSLRDCAFEEPPYAASLPRLERNGSLEMKVRRYVGGEFALPTSGVTISVLGRGEEVGRLVLMPDPDVGVSIEARVVAVALADQLGAALAADRPNHTDNGAPV